MMSASAVIFTEAPSGNTLSHREGKKNGRTTAFYVALATCISDSWLTSISILELLQRNLSHNPAASKEFMMDPHIQKIESLNELSTMLDGAEQLVEDGYKHWPSDLPAGRC
ncbi:hypothetical protein BJ138DRAFT_1160813 [Hygrophoropsis aurantiaca]|uniref:Uncharacterized protein n=1 Tax=Hygrophoropsis aurantiaca TaxID=72124 RepID=A0ACB8A1P4_9AGAM|nr:hypothetical protein BJ138DRAFT_1160813 [Hygrophoropsis aurantiaca]